LTYKQTINQKGFPDKIVMDSTHANYAAFNGIRHLNRWLPNKIIGQDYHFIKKTTKLMMRFKAFSSAEATIPTYKQFMALAV